METTVHVLSSPEDIAEDIASQLKDEVDKKNGEFFIAVSGGGTPKILFEKLASDDYNKNIDWNKIHIFWCDERMVPPDNDESNYGMTKKILLDKINIKDSNIHRVKGEEEVHNEAKRYAAEINDKVQKDENGFPRFDWIFLGLGKDGHTASLFPNQELKPVYDDISGVAVHPETGQQRISLTPKVLKDAERVTFIVTGSEKSDIVNKVITGEWGERLAPANTVRPMKGFVEWMLDKDAAENLEIKA